MTYQRLRRSGPLIGYAYDRKLQKLHILRPPNQADTYRDVTPADLETFLACRPARRYNYLQRTFKQAPTQ